MHIFAITGGIASGKSTACQFFKELIPSLVTFDCDRSVHHLLQSDPGTIALVVKEFGVGILNNSGGIDRKVLRERVYLDLASRESLEMIIHGRVREECLDSLAKAAKKGAEWFIADVPLLFEKDFFFGQTHSILIAVSRLTQISRLKVRNSFEDSLIESILAAQYPLNVKLSRADFVFWNEGPSAVLQSQIVRFVQAFS